MCMCSHSHFSAYLHVHLTLRCPGVRERASEEEGELLTLSIDERFARRRCSIAGRHGIDRTLLLLVILTRCGVDEVPSDHLCGLLKDY